MYEECIYCIHTYSSNDSRMREFDRIYITYLKNLNHNNKIKIDVILLNHFKVCHLPLYLRFLENKGGGVF